MFYRQAPDSLDRAHLYFGEGLAEDHSRSDATAHPRNDYPVLPGFRESVLDYMSALTGLAHRLSDFVRSRSATRRQLLRRSLHRGPGDPSAHRPLSGRRAVGVAGDTGRRGPDRRGAAHADPSGRGGRLAGEIRFVVDRRAPRAGLVRHRGRGCDGAADLGSLCPLRSGEW